MGASSVTGVGPGSAKGANQGSKEMTMGVGRLIGPRIMAADSTTLSSGAATVVLPALEGVTADYIVLVTTTNSSAAAVSASLVITANATTVTLAGTGAQVLSWAIIKKGLAV